MQSLLLQETKSEADRLREIGAYELAKQLEENGEAASEDSPRKITLEDEAPSPAKDLSEFYRYMDDTKEERAKRNMDAFKESALSKMNRETRQQDAIMQKLGHAVAVQNDKDREKKSGGGCRKAVPRGTTWNDPTIDALRTLARSLNAATN